MTFGSSIKMNTMLHEVEIDEQPLINNYLNLFSQANQHVELQIFDHIIIIGPSDGLYNIITAIRRYTMKYIVFFTQDIYEQ